MAIPVLIVSSTSGFRDLLRETLEETSHYAVTLVSTGAEALTNLRRSASKLAIIDCDLKDLASHELIHRLRLLQPDLPVIAFELTSEAGNLSRIARPPEAVLPKPFYLPDLLDTTARVLGIGPEPAQAAPAVGAPPVRTDPSRQPGLPWLQEVERAAQYLTQLSLESSAQAALITRAGELWAYAGHLSQPAAHELVAQINQSWNHSGDSDLVCFIRLEAFNSEFILYATELDADMVLALVFDAVMPFSKIRNQAGKLARALASPPKSAAPAQPAPVVAVKSALKSPMTPPAAPVNAADPTTEQLAFLDSLLKGLAAQEQREAAQATSRVPPAGIPSTSGLRPGEQGFKQPYPTSSLIDSASAEIPSETLPIDGNGANPALPLNRPDLPQPEREFSIRPVSPTLYHLYYACLLIPRLPDHLLAGPLVTQLTGWMGQLCLAFDWRLTAITIRPLFLQWIANPGPGASPEELVRQVRQQTSRRIFAAFPELAEQNPSGDFWAPGCLIVSTVQPLPPQLIKDFIADIRRRQGLPGKRGELA